MARRSFAICAVSLVLAFAPACRAVTVAGTTFPDQFTVGGQALELNGAGVRVFFAVVDGYASALYVRSPSRSAAELLAEPNPKVLVTRFLHAATTDQLKREFANVHDRYCAKNPCSQAGEVDYHRMVASLAPVMKNETATYVMTDNSFEVLRDGKPLLTIADPGYGHLFLAAIIGATSPTQGYRNGLLGTRG